MRGGKAAPKTPTMAALWDLVQVCMDVTRTDGLAKRHPTLKSALQELHRHPVYRWLEAGLPILMARVTRSNPIVEFEFIQHLVMNIAFMIAERKQKGARLDKPRKKLRSDIEDVMQRLFKGAVKLTPDALNVLLQLLDAARYELSIPRRKSIAHHPALLSFVRTFLRDYNLADTDIILEVSALAGLSCDERTVQRYVKHARIA
jgi:hypothetical protein